jgi:hypothetical protein
VDAGCWPDSHNAIFYLPSLFQQLIIQQHALFFFIYRSGSSSYFVQAVIAAVVGGLFYFKQAWAKIKMFFGGKKANPNPIMQKNMMVSKQHPASFVIRLVLYLNTMGNFTGR